MERIVNAQIEIKASPEAVFDAWTDPEQIKAWWGEEGSYHHTKCEFDLRVGGKWRSEGLMGNGGVFVTEGEYILINRPSALSFTWNPSWDPDAKESVVELEFHSIADGTLLTVKHYGFAADKSSEGHGSGWSGHVLPWLRRYLETGVPIKP